jgi:KTSC domain
MTLVESEAIAEIRYETGRSTMHVRFVDGEWYSYFDVPPGVHKAFVAAESHGRFFRSHIRDKYRYRRGRLTEPSRS